MRAPLLALLLASTAAGESVSLPTTWASRTATSIPGNAVAYGNGLWVAVGASGVLTTSTNGTTWTARTSSFGTTAIQDVAFRPTDKSWLIVGASRKLASSADGTTWNAITPTGINEIASLLDVDYGRGAWVLATSFAGPSTTNGLYYSENGTDWTIIDRNVDGRSHRAVAYGDDAWVSVNFNAVYVSEV